MKTFINIILFIVVWFIVSVLLLAFWVQSGGEITRMPIYYWAITFIVPYIIVYRYKLYDKLSDIRISEFLKKLFKNKPNYKLFEIIKANRILLLSLFFIAMVIFFKPINLFKSSPVLIDSLFINYDDNLVYWKKDSSLFSGSVYGSTIDKDWYGYNDSIEIGNIENGKLDGIQISWEDGEKFENKFKEGEGIYVKNYFENGVLKSEVYYNSRGDEKEWNEEGNLIYESFWDGDNKIEKTFYENGQLLSEEIKLKNSWKISYKSWYEDGSEKNLYGEKLDLLNESRVYLDSIKLINPYYPYNPSILSNYANLDTILSLVKKDNNRSTQNYVNDLAEKRFRVLLEVFTKIRDNLDLIDTSYVNYLNNNKIYFFGLFDLFWDYERNISIEEEDEESEYKPLKDSTFLKNRINQNVFSREDSLNKIILKEIMEASFQTISYNANYIFDFKRLYYYGDNPASPKDGSWIKVGKDAVSLFQLRLNFSAFYRSLKQSFILFKLIYPNDFSIYENMTIYSLKYDHYNKINFNDMNYDQRIIFYNKMIARFFHDHYLEDNFIDMKNGMYGGYNEYFRDTDNGLNKFTSELEKIIKSYASKDDFILFEFIVNKDLKYHMTGYPYWSMNDNQYNKISDVQKNRIGKDILSRYNSLYNRARVRTRNNYWTPLQSVYFYSRYISVIDGVNNNKSSKVLSVMRELESYIKSIDFSMIDPHDKMKIDQLLRNAYYAIGSYKFGRKDWRGASLAWEKALRYGRCDGDLGKFWYYLPNSHCSNIYRNLWASRNNNGDKSIACEYLNKAAEQDPDEHYQFYISKCVN